MSYEGSWRSGLGGGGSGHSSSLLLGGTRGSSGLSSEAHTPSTVMDSTGASAAMSGSKDAVRDEPSALVFGSSDLVAIHVVDEPRNVRRKFECNRRQLVKHMRYFRQFLLPQPTAPGEPPKLPEEVDISVHCDVRIFEWLMYYIFPGSHPDGRPGKLEVGNVISILISSQFLKMEELTADCVDFIAKNFNEVVRLPIDLACIDKDIVRRLALAIPDEKIDSLSERRDKLLSRVLIHRIGLMFEKSSKHLSCCVLCGQVYAAAQIRHVRCPASRKVDVGPRGEAAARHVPSKTWDINRFVRTLKGLGASWVDIYWRIWGLCTLLHCKNCKEPFSVAMFNQCRYHKSSPRFVDGANTGTFPCCDAQVRRFDPGLPAIGCTYRMHKPEPQPYTAAVLSLTQKRWDHIVIPAASSSESTTEAKSDEDGRPISSLGHHGDTSRVLHHFDTWRKSGESSPSHSGKKSAASDGSDGQRKFSERVTAAGLPLSVLTEPAMFTEGGVAALARKLEEEDISPRQARLWHIDQRRLDDIHRVRELKKQLLELRGGIDKRKVSKQGRSAYTAKATKSFGR